MRLCRGVPGAGVLSGASVLLFAALGVAQEEPAAPQAPPQEPAPAPADPAQPGVAQAPAADPAPAPAEDPAVAQAPAEPAEAEMQAQAEFDPAPAEPAPAPPPPAAEAPAEAPEADDSPVSFMLFADAYGGYQTAEHGSDAPPHRAYALNSPGFTNENLFSLSFLGLDATYDAGELAATGSARFGPSVTIFHGNDPTLGIDNITQAYATWRPVEALSLDLGMFGTIFGAEVAESWQNLNYTRGGLYYLMQPFWHTGLRASYAFSDQFSLTAMVVNGVNNITDDDESPSVALQAGIAPVDELSIAIGGLFAFDPEFSPSGDFDGSGFDRFADLVIGLDFDPFTLLFNADFNLNVDGAPDRDGDGVPDGDSTFYGLSLAAGYAFSDMFGIALRGEYLADNDNALYALGAAVDPGPDMDLGTADDIITPPDDLSPGVFTGTLTLDLKPVPDSQNLILRWDNRIEGASEDIYVDNSGDPTGIWFGSVIGLVVTTDG